VSGETQVEGLVLAGREVADLMARCQRYEHALQAIAATAQHLEALLRPTSNVPRALAAGPLLTIQGIAESALE
jgi:hypothetical protein